jgi:glycosyltransferase involved in cell wall biosynthesis
MKIVILISTAFPPEEGIGYHVYNLSKKLIEKGHSVTVVTRGFIKTENTIFDGIKIIKVPFVPLYPFHILIHSFFINKLFKVLEYEYDVLHIHLPLTPSVNTHLPILTTIHSSLVEDVLHFEFNNFKSLTTKVLTKYISFPLISKIIKKSSINTTVSKSVANELKVHYGLDNIPIVGNAVDEKLFKPSKTKEGNYILYVGRLGYRKGLFDLIDVAERICNKYSIKFLIVGKGDEYRRLNDQIKERNLEDKIIFCGHKNTNDLISIYQKSTIFISPSRYESGPLTLLEAMACGKPVIATEVGIARECIVNYENGILVKPKSVDLMVNAISYLLDNEDQRYRLGKNARKTILDNYNWNLVADKVEKYYNNIIIDR